jgi:translation initiation factor 3 subunit F
MAHSTPLRLNLGGGRREFKLHPVVVFSVLDHYKRRQDGQTRVIGTLLGRYEGSVVYVTNCFPVPHVEEGEFKVSINIEYHNTMLALQQQVNANEVVVGWYSSGVQLNYISSLIHDEYTKQTHGEAPVHLTVDVALTGHRLGVAAYVGDAVLFGAKPLMALFEEAPLSLYAYEGEKIGVDALINSQPADNSQGRLDAPATILSDFDNLELSMDKLLDMLQTASAYVAQAASGEIVGDKQIGRALLHAVEAIPTVPPDCFHRVFNNQLQDLLMVVYLANITRTQLAISDKINGLL